jgi:hypothetical protein
MWQLTHVYYFLALGDYGLGFTVAIIFLT